MSRISQRAARLVGVCIAATAIGVLASGCNQAQPTPAAPNVQLDSGSAQCDTSHGGDCNDPCTWIGCSDFGGCCCGKCDDGTGNWCCNCGSCYDCGPRRCNPDDQSGCNGHSC